MNHAAAKGHRPFGRARFIASQSNRHNVIWEDLKCAIQDSVSPSDAALSTAMAEPVKKPSRSQALARPQRESSSAAALISFQTAHKI
jgi:hypothetical protein